MTIEIAPLYLAHGLTMCCIGSVVLVCSVLIVTDLEHMLLQLCHDLCHISAL